MLTATGWLIAAALGWLAASVVLGWRRPWPVVVAQSLTPWLLALAWPLAAVALAARRPALAVTGLVLAAVHVALVAPAARRSTLSPAPPATLRLRTANVLDENPRPADVARWVVAGEADLVLLMEVTPPLDRALAEAHAGGRLPYRVEAVTSEGRRTLVLSRLPFASAEVLEGGGKPTPLVAVEVGGGLLRVAAVHPRSPDVPRHLRPWRDHLAALAEVRPHLGGPLVLAGDFNACRWHPPLRRLLRLDLRDAHEAAGRGLSRSWPANRPLGVIPAITRLDHALVSPEVAVHEVVDLECPGSDHRAFEVVVSLRGMPTHGA